jgi:hypothetical protein
MQRPGAVALALGLAAVAALATVLPVGDRGERGGALTAVLVAASPGPDSARHQADVLAQYQLLRANGVADDRIVLLTAEPVPDVVRDAVGGPNLAEHVTVDGDVSKLGEALASVDADRLYVFVAGHGNPDGIRLGRAVLTPAAPAAMLPDDGRTLVAVEACESGIFAAVGQVGSLADPSSAIGGTAPSTTPRIHASPARRWAVATACAASGSRDRSA